MPREKQPARRDRFHTGGFRFSDAYFWLLSFTYVALLSARIGGSLYFVADDLNHLKASRETGFWDYVRTPFHDHFVPLFCALNWFLFHWFPLNFGMAVTILALFHTGTLFFLHRTLALIRGGKVNSILVFFYATNVAVAAIFAWWSAGLHRAPCAFFTSVALYFAQRFFRDGRLWRLLAVSTATMLALGWYELGLLIPAYIGGLLIAQRPGSGFSHRSRLFAATAVPAVICAAYVAHWTGVSDIGGRVSTVIGSTTAVAVDLMAGFAQTATYHLAPIKPAWALVAVVTAAVLSVRVSPSRGDAARIWLVGACWVLLHAALYVGGRARFLSHIGTQPRYSFDLMFPFVLWLKLLGGVLPGRATFFCKARRTRWIIPAGALLAVVSFRQALSLTDPRPGMGSPASARRLVDGVQSLMKSGTSFSLLDAQLPPLIFGVGTQWIVSPGDYFRLADPAVPINRVAEKLFVAGEDGRLREVRVSDSGRVRITADGDGKWDSARGLDVRKGCLVANGREEPILAFSAPAAAVREGALLIVRAGVTEPVTLQVLYLQSASSPAGSRPTAEVVLAPDSEGTVIPLPKVESEPSNALMSVGLHFPHDAVPVCLTLVELAAFELSPPMPAPAP